MPGVVKLSAHFLLFRLWVFASSFDALLAESNNFVGVALFCNDYVRFCAMAWRALRLVYAGNAKLFYFCFDALWDCHWLDGLRRWSAQPILPQSGSAPRRHYSSAAIWAPVVSTVAQFATRVSSGAKFARTAAALSAGDGGA